MTTANRMLLKWMAVGATFAAAALTPGCARLTSWMRPSAVEPTASAADADAEAEPALAEEAMPNGIAEHAGLVAPAVNIFGELGAMAPARPGGGVDWAMQQHTTCDEGYDADVAVDPTGKWLVFTSTRHSTHSDIYLQRTDGAAVTQLTADPADDVQPAFCADGRRLAFASNRAGTWDVYVMDVDGRNVTQVTSNGGQEMHPSFSPDGNRVVYCSLGRSGQWELWTADLTTQEKKMIGYGLFPAWSPKEDRIAFQRARQRGSRWFSLWTLDLVDGEPRRVTEVAASSNAALVNPSWSPDGRRLAFATVVEPQKASGHLAAQQDVWVINSDGTGRQRLTDGRGTNLSPCWAVDDRVYLISDRSGAENVWSVRADAKGSATASADKSAKATPAAVGSTDGQEIGH